MRERFRIQVKGRGLILMALYLLTVPVHWVAGAATAAVIHELGHLLALWLFDVPVQGMEIDIGGAVIQTGVLTPGEELCCAFAGPAAGALLCFFWRLFPEAALCAAVQTVFTSRNYETLRRLAAQGMGYAFVPQQYIGILGGESYHPKYYAIPARYDAYWELSVVTLKDAYLSRAAKAFLREFKSSI